MDARQRWNHVMHFLPVDHVPDEEFGYWSDTLDVWHAQGLPAWVTDNAKADHFFGFSPRSGAPVNVGLLPGFQHQVLEETQHHQIILDGNGVKCIVARDGHSSIPKYLEFPLRDRQSWKEFRRRLDPGMVGRYPPNWEELKTHWQERDYPLGIGIGSLFGWIRNWMGFEGVSVMVYDDPAFFEEVMEQITCLILETITPAVEQVQFDFAAGWEDMCFNHGPIISPAMFAQYMVPRYRRITDLLKQRGVEVVITDCDGDITQLVPLWLEGGVNCMFPLEIGAGTDPFRLRDQYGERVLLLGGVDKKALIAGKTAIDRELRRIAPLVEEGGYIPHVDHRVPPDVTYENYLYYLRMKREMFGIPEPLPYEERVALIPSR